jgi:hypothetical protein
MTTNIKDHGQDIQVSSAPISMPVLGHRLRFTPTDDFEWGTGKGALVSGEACSITPDLETDRWIMWIGKRRIGHSTDLRQAIVRLENNIGRPFTGADRVLLEPAGATETEFEVMAGGGEIFTTSPAPDFPIQSATMTFQPVNDAQWGSENFELASEEGFAIKLSPDATQWRLSHGERLLCESTTMGHALGVAERTKRTL